MAGCQRAGFSPRVAHRAGDWQAVMGLVAADLGHLARARGSRTPRRRRASRSSRLTGVPPKRHVFAACRAGAESNPAIRAVLDALADGGAASSAASGMSAVIFDLDGVLVDSEQVWDQARRDVVAAHGGTWKDSGHHATCSA